MLGEVRLDPQCCVLGTSKQTTEDLTLRERSDLALKGKGRASGLLGYVLVATLCIGITGDRLSKNVLSLHDC